MMLDNVGFLTFSQMRGEANVGSSYIRAQALIAHWKDAEEFVIGRRYSVVVFQKAYWLEYARSFTGIKIVDLCDPDFLSGQSPCLRMVHICDAVTTSTVALAEHVAKYTKAPVLCIPDRLDCSRLTAHRKDHRNRGGAKTVAWYGYSTNFEALDYAIPSIVDQKIRRLVVIANDYGPYLLAPIWSDKLEVINYVWDPATIQSHLLEADIVINFQPAYGRWLYKSNNKTLQAWALGLPVAHTAAELDRFVAEGERVAEGQRRYAEVRRDWDVRQSVTQYQELIQSLRLTDRSSHR